MVPAFSVEYPPTSSGRNVYGTFSWALSSCCFRFWLGQLDLRIYVSVQLVTGRGYGVWPPTHYCKLHTLFTMIYLVLSLHFCHGLVASHAGFLYYFIYHGVATVSPWWIYDTKYNKCQRCWQTLGGDISVHRSFGSASLHPGTTRA